MIKPRAQARNDNLNKESRLGNRKMETHQTEIKMVKQWNLVTEKRGEKIKRLEVSSLCDEKDDIS